MGLEKKKKQSLKSLNDRYTHRITLAKQGKQASAQGDVRNAIKYYNMYLKVLADVKDVPDIDGLSPEHFNVEKELSELLLISHIYWDLCKMFDLTPHLESEFQRTLDKFVEFTLGKKYQVVNAEMLRKFIRRGKHVHKEAFKEAYNKIYIASKKCYVATYCFGEDHPVTETLRQWRGPLAQSKVGLAFIELYYRVSPKIVAYCQRHRVLSFCLTQLLFRPVLWALAKILQGFVLRR